MVKYHISIDAVNCIENTINHCNFAYQYYREDTYAYVLRIYTLDPGFQPMMPSALINSACARCEDYYATVVADGVCVPIIYL